MAGSNALGAHEIFQEGLRLPVVKFLERGVPNQALWDVITLNVRTPEKVLGDLQAQIAACKSCEKELGDLLIGMVLRQFCNMQIIYRIMQKNLQSQKSVKFQTAYTVLQTI